MLGEEQMAGGRAAQRVGGHMRERERTSAGGAMDDVPAGRWFTPVPSWSTVLSTDPDADTQLLARSELRAELSEGAEATAVPGPGTTCGPHGLEAGVFAGLTKALGADGMPAGAVAVHLADLAEMRAWLGGPLWQMNFEDADAYFGKQIAWHEYPAMVRRAHALTRYFAVLAGPDGALAREHVHAPVRCPLDALNWPAPSHLARNNNPRDRAEPSSAAMNSAG